MRSRLSTAGLAILTYLVLVASPALAAAFQFDYDPTGDVIACASRTFTTVDGVIHFKIHSGDSFHLTARLEDVVVEDAAGNRYDVRGAVSDVIIQRDAERMLTHVFKIQILEQRAGGSVAAVNTLVHFRTDTHSFSFDVGSCSEPA